MRTWIIAAVSGAAALCCGSLGHAEDNQAGVPLSPADAAGPWTLEADGHSICTITLGKERVPTVTR